jgi:pilus assembly protein CpaB
MMSGPQASGPSVVIVEQPIDAGKPILGEQIKAISWSGSVVPQEAFSRTADVVGRIALVSMIPGEPVLPGKLAPTGATGGLSSIIPKGKRAISVRVNDVVGVAGFALPGSYVDVLVSGRDVSGQPFSRIVLSRVKVLAVEQDTVAEKDKPKVVNAVTLELSPQESEKLDLARNIGALSLVLRNELDTTVVNSVGTRLPDVVYPQRGVATKFSQPAQAAPSQALQAAPPRASQASPARQYRGTEEIRGISRQQATTP